ncbi:hypothetical protein [Aeromicrobium camelliae]|nr:hypothetical protein [Aeromicrobium camelliae]
MTRPGDTFANRLLTVIVDQSTTTLDDGRDGVARGRLRGRFERNA